MAKKSKKSDVNEVGSLVDKLISDVADDRERLTKFMDGLIDEYDGEKAVGIAEYVAKLSDALTKQHQVKALAVKSLMKSLPEDDDGFDDINKEIGMPFKLEESDGSN